MPTRSLNPIRFVRARRQVGLVCPNARSGRRTERTPESRKKVLASA
jgi:hypothetical protein